jgi:hypothetical protein
LDLVANDNLLIGSQRVFIKLGLDLGDRRTRLDRVPSVSMQIVRLNAAADALRHNADDINNLLASIPDPAPDAVVRAGEPANSNDAELGEIKRQLAGIAAVEQAQSDQIFEIADTMRMGQMRIDLVKTTAVTDPSGSIVNNDVKGNSEFTAAYLQAAAPAGAPFYQSTNVRGYISDVQMIDSTLFGHTVYDMVGLNIAQVQANTIRFENRVGAALLADVRTRCDPNNPPQGSPVP